jgi:hypothetical protein
MCLAARAWCVVDRGGGVGPLAVWARLAIGFAIAKIANSCRLIGNLGYLFCIAKSANDWRENRQREGVVTWRPRFGLWQYWQNCQPF